MYYILLAIIFYAILFNTLSITLLIALKTPQRTDRGQNATHCRACNVLLIEHNHGCQFETTKPIEVIDYCNICEHWYCHTCEHCKSTEGMSFVTPDTTPDTPDVKINTEEVNMKYCEICGESYFTHNGDGSCISDRELEIENQLLSDYFKYRDMVMELKALPPGIEHVDGNTENNEVENLSVNKQMDFELITSGLAAQGIVKYDQSLTWTEQIKLWKERETTIYPEGYEQTLILLEDDKYICKSDCKYDKVKFKAIIKVEKVKKTRKSKVRV
jgi:hypothetical protein